MLEFAIADQTGALQGNPTRYFSSEESARNLCKGLEDAISRLEIDAVHAQQDLVKISAGEGDFPPEHQQACLDAVTRWGANQGRTFHVLRREVTEWSTA